jgi:protein required for attachment to host cells
MPTKTVWVVAADASRARVLQVAGPERLVEIENLPNPEGRAHDRDLQTDAEPRFNGHGGVGKAGTAPTGGPGSDRETQGPREHAAATFARRVGDYLEKARTDHRYDELVVIAPPKFLGALRKEMGKEVEKLVAGEMPKDLSWLSQRELEGYFTREGRSL